MAKSRKLAAGQVRSFLFTKDGATMVPALCHCATSTKGRGFSPVVCVCDHGPLAFAPSRCALPCRGMCPVLILAGGTIIDSFNNILKRWLWDPSRQNAGTAPRDPIEFRLNKFLRFKFVDRKTITVSFKCGVLKMEFDCGEKLRREDTYLQAYVHGGLAWVLSVCAAGNPHSGRDCHYQLHRCSCWTVAGQAQHHDGHTKPDEAAAGVFRSNAVQNHLVVPRLEADSAPRAA